MRRRAYEAEISAYPRIEIPMAACLNGIKGEALTLMDLRHYDSVLDSALDVSRMDRETLDALLDVMRESLPMFRRYFRLKAKMLGYEGGLKFYDLFAPVGESHLHYTLDEARAMLVRVIGSFSPVMAEFIDRAFEERWIDVYPREGKQGGAFCSGVHPLKMSYVMTNFDGSYSSVSTLAHELGHAYHDRCMEGVSVLLSDYPMPLAETASIFNETLLMEKMLETADDATKLTLIEQQVGDAAQVVVDILSRYLFESEVVDRRKERSLSPRELCEIMLDAQRQTYGDGLDPDCMHPYMWACKSHYYDTDVHFYNFPYAFGLLFGLGVFARYQRDGEAFLAGIRPAAALHRLGQCPRGGRRRGHRRDRPGILAQLRPRAGRQGRSAGKAAGIIFLHTAEGESPRFYIENNDSPAKPMRNPYEKFARRSGRIFHKVTPHK